MREGCRLIRQSALMVPTLRSLRGLDLGSLEDARQIFYIDSYRINMLYEYEMGTCTSLLDLGLRI